MVYSQQNISFNMKKEYIQISLTEFINFINSSAMSKVSIVSRAKERREEEKGKPYDYWEGLKLGIKDVIKKGGIEEDFWEIVENVREELQPNYSVMIKGFLKFWKPKKMTWIKTTKKIVNLGGTHMILNPELGIRIGGEDHLIKLYLKANEILDKRHADLILALMESELRPKVRPEVSFSILDVRRGKLFSYVNEDPRILSLLKTEGESFSKLWREL